MKNQTIRDRYAALVVLSQRTLPSPTAVNKVTALLVRFRPAYEATEEGRKAVIALHPVPDTWTGERLPAGLLEERQAGIDAYLQLAQPIRKVPDTLRLTEADLPRALKSSDGEKNTEGLAEIVNNLGSLYKLSDDARALDEATEGEELE